MINVNFGHCGPKPPKPKRRFKLVADALKKGTSSQFDLSCCKYWMNAGEPPAQSFDHVSPSIQYDAEGLSLANNLLCRSIRVRHCLAHRPSTL